MSLAGLDALRARVHDDPALARALHGACARALRGRGAAAGGGAGLRRRRGRPARGDRARAPGLDAALGSLAAGLRGWTPVWARSGAGEPVVEWALLDGPFHDPFFEQTADRAMQHPFNQVFARRTPLAAVDAVHAAEPGLAPSGFVFHMSRCGSTLVAQMLAALPATIVLSEAQPLDALLRLRRRMAGANDELLAGRLRAMLSVLGRARGGERRLFVKFHAWHVLELPFIARTFPGVPWAFVFREPRAVLRSQVRSTGAELVAGNLDPAYFRLDGAAAHALPPAEYGARVLAAFCMAALASAELGRAAFFDYADLPDAVPARLLEHFGVPPGERDAERMRAATVRDTKAAGAAFSPRDDGGDGAHRAVGVDLARRPVRGAAARSPSEGSGARLGTTGAMDFLMNEARSLLGGAEPGQVGDAARAHVDETAPDELAQHLTKVRRTSTRVGSRRWARRCSARSRSTATTSRRRRTRASTPARRRKATRATWSR